MKYLFEKPKFELLPLDSNESVVSSPEIGDMEEDD